MMGSPPPRKTVQLRMPKRLITALNDDTRFLSFLRDLG